MIVYTAGRYTGDIDANIALARKVAMELWQCGFTVICPHLNTAHFEQDCKTLDWQDYMNGDLEMIERVDALVMLPGWEDSKGAVMEKAHADVRRIPVYFYPNLPEKSDTERLRPTQCKEFIDIVMQMYRVHLATNSDYSSANILGTGMVGLATRMWDKIARFMNLVGFKIEISDSSFEHPHVPKNESIDDTLMDLSVYGIIAMIYKKGFWGK